MGTRKPGAPNAGAGPNGNRHRRLVFPFVAFALVIGSWPVAADEEPDITDLSLEELADIEVTSVSKKAERSSEAAAALYVITQEDIRRSGVTTIADALRLVPGVHVAKIDSNKWEVSVRGSSSQFSNKLLLLMDGRSVYTPLFAGVFWDVQDTLLADIERIEVIRGPGGTLWGSNAVNGVINVITRSARDTQGLLVSGGGGDEERAFVGARYGGRFGEGFYYRVYGKYFDRDGGFDPVRGGFDDWHMARGGFRADWDVSPADLLTVQGDVYAGRAGQAGLPGLALVEPGMEFDERLTGGNVIGRWTRTLGESSDATVQAYYDYTDRNELFFRERRGTFDLDFQHRFPLPWRQEFVWGAGYRLTSDEFRGSLGLDLMPDDRDVQLASMFVQDEIWIVPDRVRFTLGSKFEHNDYTGVDIQPSGRIAWLPTAGQTVWGSISRAVRTPSRFENDVSFEMPDPDDPIATRFTGDRHLDNEKLLAYEAGYRVHPVQRLFLDLALFYNVYDDVVSVTPGAPFFEPEPPPGHPVVPLSLTNRIDGEVYGFELAADAQVLDWWRIRAAYSHLQMDIDVSAPDQDLLEAQGSSPQNQLSARSQLDLPWKLELDAAARYVDNLPARAIGSYFSADVQLARYIVRGLRVAVVGQNLLEDHHREFSDGTELERGVFGKLTWTY
jgi:iron complex outermembrane receptor protein